MRQIVLDTETTGINPKEGHRIIEIGCVELIDRKLTGRHYHQYIKPDVGVGDSVNVHGITDEFLQDKPLFESIVDAFVDFIKGSELVIHNAAFDVGFIEHEFNLMKFRPGKVADYCTVLDTLKLAKKLHPGSKVNLDALCKRYGIDNSKRDYHGALLDSEILADVYLAMTGGQTALSLGGDADSAEITAIQRLSAGRPALKVIRASQAEISLHQDRLAALAKASGKSIDW